MLVQMQCSRAEVPISVCLSLLLAREYGFSLVFCVISLFPPWNLASSLHFSPKCPLSVHWSFVLLLHFLTLLMPLYLLSSINCSVASFKVSFCWMIYNLLVILFSFCFLEKLSLPWKCFSDVKSPQNLISLLDFYCLEPNFKWSTVMYGCDL